MDSAVETAEVREPVSSVMAEKRDLLARLLGRLAHEIRNPLSSLDIHVQLLEEDLSSAAPATRQRLEIIRGELTRLEGIVRRFLRLASPSALELERVEIAQLVNHAGKLLAPEAAARQVDLLTEISPDLPALRADSGQLTQALLNLLINAIQAVDRQGRVRVRALVSECGSNLVVEVHGIAQQIAAAHGGSLQVSNASGGGAIFRLTLPLPDPPLTDG
jgi:two-component system sensor histidine kinase HydH